MALQSLLSINSDWNDWLVESAGWNGGTTSSRAYSAPTMHGRWDSLSCSLAKTSLLAGIPAAQPLSPPPGIRSAHRTAFTTCQLGSRVTVRHAAFCPPATKIAVPQPAEDRSAPSQAGAFASLGTSQEFFTPILSLPHHSDGKM